MFFLQLENQVPIRNINIVSIVGGGEGVQINTNKSNRIRRAQNIFLPLFFEETFLPQGKCYFRILFNGQNFKV